MWTSDRELIEACQAQNPKAQEYLYRKFAGKLLGVCLRYARTRADAEDIFQEAFVRVFRSIHTLQQTEALYAWVKRIVVNTAINHYHRHKKYQEHLVFDDAPTDSDDHAAYQQILANLSSEDLLRVVNRLPDGYRMVFNLYVLEGYSHQEVAEMLNMNPANSKVQLSKAKKKLRKMLVELNLIEKDENTTRG